MRWFPCLLAILLAPAAPRAASGDFPADLARWSRSEPPRVSGIRWREAQRDADREWVVYLDGDRPSARLRAARNRSESPYPERQESYPPMPFAVPTGSIADGLAGEWTSTPVDDGWIIGYNKGEWGGRLWWFSPDGTRRRRISEDQVVGFYQTGAGLLAAEGLAHGGGSRGRLVRLARGGDGQWRSETFLDLGGAPEVAALGRDGTLTVATHDRLLRVHPATRQVDVILRDAFWESLYPKSMILAPSGSVYLGMRHGVAEIRKTDAGYETKWLLPRVEIDRPPPKKAR